MRGEKELFVYSRNVRRGTVECIHQGLGRKGHVLHKFRDTLPGERTEGETGRGGAEVIGQGDSQKRKKIQRRFRDLRVKRPLRGKEARAQGVGAAETNGCIK